MKLQSNEVIKVKMNYIAPEAKLLGFAPAEATATSFDDLLNNNGGLIPGENTEATYSDGDITLEGVGI